MLLSYSRADQDRARVLAQALEREGLQAWWDALIEGGAAFARTIETALQASDAVIVLWSARSVASDWVLDEAAHGRDMKKLVPLSLDGWDKIRIDGELPARDFTARFPVLSRRSRARG